MDTTRRRRSRTMKEWLRDIDEDIKAAEEQAGRPMDNDISDGPDLDDEESDARLNT